MKTLLALLLTFGIIGYNFAQTTEVQTLTLDDNATSGTFTFPDDDSKTYEKIWMVYQMRCHEDQVGSGNVGCREWDYSCNTFITDPTRMDSTLATHPTHIIPGFTEDVFEFTTLPTYAYLSIDQQEMVHGDVLVENSATIDGGNSTSDLYFNANRKIQCLFTAEELLASGLVAGDITDIKLEVKQSNGPINFVKIKMKATTAIALDPGSTEQVGLTEHYFQHTQLTNDAWHRFPFYQAFNWDGTSNILVELSYTSPDTGDGNLLKWKDSNFDSSLSLHEDSHLDFNGSGEVRFNINAIEEITDEVTISTWTYGNENVLPINTYLLEAVDENNNRTVNVHLPWSNGRIYWDCGNNGSTYDRIDKEANFEDFAGKWNHWTFTKNTNTGSMKIYLNGELWHSGTGKTHPINIDQIVLGKSANGNGFYNGAIDDFQIWKKELDAATIKAYYSIFTSDTHPNYADLACNLTFDENSGNSLTDFTPGSPLQFYTGAPVWRSKKGEKLFKQALPFSLRPHISFEQNTYTGDVVNTIAVIDSIQNPQFAIFAYDVDGTDLVQTTTDYYWQAGNQSILDEQGMEVGSVNFPAEGTINIDELQYFLKRDSKYEILSLVTPYGNGLDLGPNGKTYLFDVTDYAPILKGERRLSVELGGQNQEELDIKFLFVEGTPARPVLDIQNIWPFARGWFDPILNDAVFEPREIPIAQNAAQVKIRSSITGHGQNGEFVPRTHYININEGAKEFEYEVWKRCSQNPVYPQGGTWTFDRAGWCPGMATDVHEFDITSMVTPGGSVIVDYGLNGNTMSEANYLVSNQLVTYGEPSFQIDAEVVEIQRPTNRVEFARFNPTCDDPLVVIRNTGQQTLQSLEFTYGVLDGESFNYSWTGNLEFMETAEVLLPVDDLEFWGEASGNGVFDVVISQPNGTTDEYPDNNNLSSNFEPFDYYTQEGLEIELKTNLRPNENKLIVKDGSGTTLGTLENMQASTTYIQEIDFPTGCYSVTLEDSGDDGLYYWYWAAVGQNVGAGSMRISYALTPDIQLPLLSFEPEFGGDLYYNFSIPETVSNANLQELRKFLLYPNPGAGIYQLDLEGLPGQEVAIEIWTDNGQLISSNTHTTIAGKLNKTLDIEEQPAGTYFIRVIGKDRVWVKPLIKM